MKVNEKSEKVGLKMHIQKTKIMASGPITSRQIDAETVQTVLGFIFLGSKITADGDQCRVFIERTDAEAETPILWPPNVKSWLIWKDPDAGKDWGWEEKGTTEDEMVGWHHQLNGHEFG